MTVPDKLLFLPGASGNVDFWKPVDVLRRTPIATVKHVGWPGFGPTPAEPSVTSLPSLVDRVVAEIDRPTALVAQSMGCVVAILAALARPDQVTHLVLAALSGGVDMKRHGARDWRPPSLEITSEPSHLFAAYNDDLSPLLPSIAAPTLLLWGDSDPISPVGVGQWLSEVMHRAELHVVRGGGHTFANFKADEIAPLIDRHLSAVA